MGITQLADVGGMTGFVNTLKSIRVPPDVIDDLVKILHEQSTSLEDGSFQDIPPAWFGDRFSAVNLGDHTNLAHAHLANSVLEAVASVQATGEAIELFDKELGSADGNSHAATTALLHRTQHAVNQLDDNRFTPPELPIEGGKP